jgi:hypothetical protein
MFQNKLVPTLLSALAASWDDEAANTLLWEQLWHQQTCCGATYAAVPHLLKIAEPQANRHQRREIALFLGQVALDTDPRQHPRDQSKDGDLQAPEMFVGWAIEPLDAGDLEKVRSIKAEFYSALPAIRTLCERALLENWDVDRYLLSGIAAADGLIGIASLLNHGCDGQFTCGSCGWDYEFIRFGERVAVYADAPRGARHEDNGLSDFKDGTPSRADGFMTPIAEGGVIDARVAALLALAKRAPRPEPALLLRHFAGSFVCCKCGVQGPMHPLW